MKKSICMLIVAIVIPFLNGCFDKGSPADPPSNFVATAEDGRVKLTWAPNPGVEYWLFTATDPSLTAFNWVSLANKHVYVTAATPFYMCGLINGILPNGTLSPLPYYFAANGRINGGPGGSSSPTITATPYNASVAAWTLGSIGSTNLYGVGYVSLTTCSNNTISAAGNFAVVGAGGAISTSSDGKIWSSPIYPVSTNLYAVTGYAANLNNPTTPNLRWIAVGDGGISVFSLDGTNWTVGNAYNSSSTANPNNYPLRSITHSAGTFIAVGDAGTILSTTDGITWTAHTSGTTNNLNGVARGGIYVAVGDGGTILTSLDGNTWTTHASTPALTNNLRQVAAYGSLIVAVGDGGAVVTSKDNGATWYTQTQGTANLVGVAAESLVTDPANSVANTDAWLTVVPNAQFVIVDSSGNAYASVIGTNPSENGLTWSPQIPTGLANPNALVSSGFGYVAAGNTGTTAYAF